VKQYTDACNLAKKELDVIKTKIEGKAEEKRLTMREDMMDYQDEEGEDGSPGRGMGGGAG
jgi:hypothetical protein